MAQHDYRCPVCGHVERDIVVPASIGARKGAPLCPKHDTPYEDLHPHMEWIPAMRMSLLSDSGKGFSKFTVRDGRDNLVEVDSLHKLRQIERESEIAARNGEGQQMCFRAFSQNQGNRLDGTLGDAPDHRPSAEAKRKFGLRGAARPMAVGESGEPDVTFGPGVNESNASALQGG